MPVKTATKEETPDELRTYEFHGILFHGNEGEEHKGHCPFCGGKAFFVNQSTSKFHCKTCPASGNKYNFLQLYYDYWYTRTTQAHFDKLGKDRGLPGEAFELVEFAWDADNKVWLIPVRNAKDSMVNLGKWNPKPLKDGTRPVFLTAGCKAHLHNISHLKNAKQAWIVEGYWDYAALTWLLHQNKAKDAAILPCPGSNTFKEDWAKDHFNGLDVIVPYDHDDAGRTGKARVVELIKKHSKPKTISTINWPDSLPDKYDIRDYVVKNVKRPVKALEELLYLKEEIKLVHRARPDITRTKFSELVQDFENCIHCPQEMQDGLLLSLAVTLSNDLFTDPYCPIWLYIVAPSGRGKTLILQTTAGLDNTRFETTLGPKTLISGFKSPDGSDVSLLPHIIGKTLIIEDFTAIMNLSSGDQDEIYGVLRTAYNGRYEKTFGHLGTRVYPEPGSNHETCHFTILAGCTGVIHADKRANEGERFLKFHMHSNSYNPIPQVRSAIDKTIEGETPEVILRDPVNAFIEYKLANMPEKPATVPPEIIERTIGLAQITASLISFVVRKNGEMVSRPETGVATRISKQLIKIGQAVCFVLDKPEIDEEVYRIMQRVAINTAYGWHCDAFVAVAQADHSVGVVTKEVSAAARMKGSTAHRCLEDLMELGLINMTFDSIPTRGRPTSRWFLSELSKELWTMAKIDPTVLSNDPPAGMDFKRRAKDFGTPQFDDHPMTNGKPLPRKPIKKVVRRTAKKKVATKKQSR